MSQAAELNQYENYSSSIMQKETEFSVSDETPRGGGGVATRLGYKWVCATQALKFTLC